MKMITLILFLSCLVAGAKGFAQNITISLKNAPLEKVFKEVERQSQYRFVYTKEQLENVIPVTVEVKNASLESILLICFKEQPITYNVENKYILIKNVEKKKVVEPLSDVRGKIVNEKGEPVPGVTITVKGTNRSTVSNNEGDFYFKGIDLNAVLIISGAEMKNVEVRIENRNYLTISVNAKIGELDQVIMMAYGQTTKRLNTGNISKVTAEQIARQPVSNVLAALEGRVPGLIITQSNGYGNGGFAIQLRGQNSIAQGSQPFIIIDGVPFAPQNTAIGVLSSASGGGTSPLFTINPADIESIEILKDADATAIYGSRGANGVILITTKRGQSGKTKITINQYFGWGKIARTMKMLNTQQYIQMRREAFTNDGLTITGNNAADILLWDSTRNTDVKNLFLGGTAKTFNTDLSLSGGNSSTTFLLSASYNRQTTVLPVDLANHRASFHSALNHTSLNKKFEIKFVNGYTYARILLPSVEPTAYINRPPNMKFYDSAGNLNWQESGVSFRSTGIADFSNPLASLNTTYEENVHELNSSLLIKYQLFSFLNFTTSLGYNSVNTNEHSTRPTSSIDPFGTNTPSANFADARQSTWIIEPRLEAKKSLKIGTFNFLLGNTWQRKTGESISVNARNYTSDILLNSISGAGTILTFNHVDEYKYTGFFGRFSYNQKDQYIVNFTGRRDGSSRFGPGKRFDNFGAVGGAWIFSKQKMFRHWDWMSFGKLRISYGSSGNDAIGDYQFLDTWSNSTSTYQGVPILNPSALFNSDLAWERNKKLDIGFDIGLFKEKIHASSSFFTNRSDNQLIAYNLPIQTGFNSVNKNRNALVENKGFDFTLEAKIISHKNFSWTSQFNITVSRNRLLKFPGLETSSYANLLIIDEPLSVVKKYQYLDVDPLTGSYRFTDINNDGILNLADKISIKNLQPKFYGGLESNFTYKGFELDIFFQFVRQPGLTYLYTIGTFPPGVRFTNQPAIVFERWRKPGDVAGIAKFSTSSTSADLLGESDAVYGDASFIRCKNLFLSYRFPAAVLKKNKLDGLQLYLQSQNLFTITDYVGSDPENQNLYSMPPLKQITLGCKLNF